MKSDHNGIVVLIISMIDGYTRNTYMTNVLILVLADSEFECSYEQLHCTFFMCIIMLVRYELMKQVV